MTDKTDLRTLANKYDDLDREIQTHMTDMRRLRHEKTKVRRDFYALVTELTGVDLHIADGEDDGRPRPSNLLKLADIFHTGLK